MSLHTFNLLLQAGIFSGVCLIFLHYLLVYLTSPLKKVPGPFLAKFTNGWRFWNHYRRAQIPTQRALHKKYGKYVRIGPSTVSINDPALAKTIYSTRMGYLKGDFYRPSDTVQNGQIIQTIFSTPDPEFHQRTLRPIQKLFTTSSVVELEPLMDRTLRYFCSQLEDKFINGVNHGNVCDFDAWMSYYAWDILSETSFSKRLGFLEAGEDIKGVLSAQHAFMRYFGLMSQIPWLDWWISKNTWSPISLPDTSHTVKTAAARLAERLQSEDKAKHKDFLNSFLALKEKYPETVSDYDVIGYLVVIMLAGADTIAIAQKAILYWILKNPEVHRKLVAELDAAKLPFPAPYNLVKSLPYLDACVKEGLRIHPGVGQVVERVVPAGGLTLDNGTVLPPGTNVGMNPWVLHFNEDPFGEKPDEFRPERWLQGPDESDEEYEVRIHKMKDADFSFGMGSRICLGKWIALMELYKVTATMFSRYDIRFEDPQKEWKLDKEWLVWPSNIRIKLDFRGETTKAK